jgi:hypothetical protein
MRYWITAVILCGLSPKGVDSVGGECICHVLIGMTLGAFGLWFWPHWDDDFGGELVSGMVETD